MRRKMVSNYGVIPRQTRDGEDIFCYSFFSSSPLIAQTGVCS